MLVTELNFQVENEHAQSFIPPEGYWSNYRNYYRAKQRVEMPSWIAEMKKRRNSDRSISVRVIYVTTLNELQNLTYKIVKDHFTISNEIRNEKPFFLFVKGIAGSGKCYVIAALRNILQSKCRVSIYTGKAAFIMNGVTMRSCRNCLLVQSDNMTREK